MAGMGDEIGEVGTLRQMPRIGCGGVEDDDHRARLQLLLDAGGDLADMGVRNGENDDVGAVQSLVGGHGVEAETVLQPLLPASLTST